ncbi:MAG: HAMP domain-containing histidine kinase [Planctomycetes bacterium]|nr:HAMP domain-containing histidine kinase [Planctomycetota bacterium]
MSLIFTLLVIVLVATITTISFPAAQGFGSYTGLAGGYDVESQTLKFGTWLIVLSSSIFAACAFFAIRLRREMGGRTASLEQKIIDLRAEHKLEREQYQYSTKYLQSLSEKLREMNSMKSSFLANTSHELRSPLNSILGYTELILEENQNLSEFVRKDLEVVRRHAHNLLMIINDILDLSKIEAGKIDITVDNLDLRSLLQAEVDSIKPLVRDKKLKVGLTIFEGLPVIKTDRDKLRQVIANILTNAAKFTQSGEIEVIAKFHEKGLENVPEQITNIRLTETDSGVFAAPSALVSAKSGNSNLSHGPCVSVAVRDTGLGIPRSELQSIFEEFRQVDGSTTRRFGGTGLGLAIARRLMSYLGGTITVESTVGVGSTFTLLLPLEVSETNSITQRLKRLVPQTSKNSSSAEFAARRK